MTHFVKRVNPLYKLVVLLTLFLLYSDSYYLLTFSSLPAFAYIMLLEYGITTAFRARILFTRNESASRTFIPAVVLVLPAEGRELSLLK